MKVTVTSSSKLSKSELSKLEKALAKKYPQKKLDLEAVVNEDMGIGVTVQVGQTQYSSTVKDKLQALETELLKAINS